MADQLLDLIERLCKILDRTETRLEKILERTEDRVDMMRVYCDQAKLDAMNARVQRTFVVDFINSMADLMVTHGKAFDWQQLKRQVQILKNREGVRLSIDNWFWRPEPDISLREQLLRRAKYLKSQNYSIDQQWDLLVEYVAAWTKEDVDESLIKIAMSGAHNASAE